MSEFKKLQYGSCALILAVLTALAILISRGLLS